jgi:hypothetical protein
MDRKPQFFVWLQALFGGVVNETTPTSTKGCSPSLSSVLEGLEAEFAVDTPVNEANRSALQELLTLKGEKLDILKQTYATIEKRIKKQL